MTGKAVLIIGKNPSLVDFAAPSAPPNMSAEKVMAGLNGSVERLRAAGHKAQLLLTDDAAPVEAQVVRALGRAVYDVIMVGAGLRTLPPMADEFERIMNVLHQQASHAKLAFNANQTIPISPPFAGSEELADENRGVESCGRSQSRD